MWPTRYDDKTVNLFVRFLSFLFYGGALFEKITAQRVTQDWLVDEGPMKGELRSVLRDSGVLCVMTTGAQ